MATVKLFVVPVPNGPPEATTVFRELRKVKLTSSMKLAPLMVTTNVGVAPTTSSCDVPPGHTVLGVADAVGTAGVAPEPTRIVSVSEQPAAFVAVTVYVVGLDGVAVTGLPVVELNPVAGDQL